MTENPQSDKTPEVTTPKLTLFTGPNCVPCKAVKPRVQTYAAQHELSYTELSIENPAAADSIRELNIMSVPTLVVNTPAGTRVISGMSEILRALPTII